MNSIFKQKNKIVSAVFRAYEDIKKIDYVRNRGRHEQLKMANYLFIGKGTEIN